MGESPLLAFHSAFDEAMINKADAKFRLKPLKNKWSDIEPLAKITGVNPRLWALDEWLKYFGIE